MGGEYEAFVGVHSVSRWGGTNPWQTPAVSGKLKCTGLTSQCLELLGQKRSINRGYLNTTSEGTVFSKAGIKSR